MIRLFTLLALVCTVFSVQAIRASETFNPVAPQVASSEFEINFLHAGSPQLMDVDLSKGVVFFKALVSDREVWVLLDNGAANTIIDVEIAAELGIAIDDSAGDIRTSTRRLDTKIVRQVEVQIPGQMQFTADLYATDFSSVSSQINRPIGLVLGNDILSKMTYVIDAQFSRVLFVRSDAISLSGGNLQHLPFENGIVEAEVGGNTARLKIDLGSNHPLTIFEHSWERLIPESDDSQQTVTSDASGLVRTEQVYLGTALTVGRFTSEVRSTRSVYPDTEVDGHIGFPYFRDKLLVVDESAGKITLVQRDLGS